MPNSNIKIFISCHKECTLLKNKYIYPIQVGSALADKRFPDMLHDDVGDNISSLNPMYCELTAQYWAWKNVDADYIGLVHYRRHFKGKKCKSKEIKNRVESVLGNKQLEELLNEVDVVLPKKRNYIVYER